VQPTIDPEKVKADAVVQIGDINVAVDNMGKNQWSLVNRLILLFKGRLGLRIIRLAAVVQRRSTFNQGGVLQG